MVKQIETHHPISTLFIVNKQEKSLFKGIGLFQVLAIVRYLLFFRILFLDISIACKRMETVDLATFKNYVFDNSSSISF